MAGKAAKLVYMSGGQAVNSRGERKRSRIINNVPTFPPFMVILGQGTNKCEIICRTITIKRGLSFFSF